MLFHIRPTGIYGEGRVDEEPHVSARSRICEIDEWPSLTTAYLPYIQAQLGHESITTTIDTYGHLMPNSNRHVTHAFDRALRGGKIERYQGLAAAQ
jgi:hypothetical protein